MPLIPADMYRPPGAVSYTLIWWDADGNTTEGPTPGGHGALSFLDAHEDLVATFHLAADVVHTPNGPTATAEEKA